MHSDCKPIARRRPIARLLTNEHQGLCFTECVHQLIFESVEWLVTAVTGELQRQLSDCCLTVVAGRRMRRLA